MLHNIVLGATSQIEAILAKPSHTLLFNSSDNMVYHDDWSNLKIGEITQISLIMPLEKRGLGRMSTIQPMGLSYEA